MATKLLPYVVDAIEWLWTGIALFGLVVCFWAFIDSLRDRRALRVLNQNSDALIIVRMNLRGARASLLLHSFFLGLGVLALLSKNPPLSSTYLVFAGCYIVVAATNARAIGLNQLDRIRMRSR